MDPCVIDTIISKLLERNESGKKLSEADVRQLLHFSRGIFLEQPNLLQLNSPITVCGPICYNYSKLLQMFEDCGVPPKISYLFLGNFVWGGSMDITCLLLAYKIKYPNVFFLLRGIYECCPAGSSNWLYEECQQKYNTKLLKEFVDCFNCLPVAALINNKIFCVSSGISPHMNSLQDINNIVRPSDVPSGGLLHYLLQTYPSLRSSRQGWLDDRFGTDVVSEFLHKHKLNLICCGSFFEPEDGYEFFAGRQLIAISWLSYNKHEAVVMYIDESLTCSIKYLRPNKHEHILSFSSANATSYEDRIETYDLTSQQKSSDAQETITDSTKPRGTHEDQLDNAEIDIVFSQKMKINSADSEIGVSSSHETLNPSNETKRFKSFTFKEIHAATSGLSESSKIGKGGYGSVYKGRLDNSEVAIKILDPNSSQGSVEFLQEIVVLGGIRHPNLIRLIGACSQIYSLVYEFVPNGSLEDCLKERSQDLTWKIRIRIIFEICSVLTFLHSQMPRPMVHGDLKPQNILLDNMFTAKLADFGLCRFMPEGFASATHAFHITRNINGTEWYMDPYYLVSGKLTPGCDVYSFGITIMRVLTGLPVADLRMKVKPAFKEKTLMNIVDLKLLGIGPKKWPCHWEA